MSVYTNIVVMFGYSVTRETVKQIEEHLGDSLDISLYDLKKEELGTIRILADGMDSQYFLVGLLVAVSDNWGIPLTELPDTDTLCRDLWSKLLPSEAPGEGTARLSEKLRRLRITEALDGYMDIRPPKLFVVTHAH